MTAPVQELIAQAAAVVRGGGVVCFPTETYYGLAVDALNGAAVARLVELKGRAETAPIALIVPSPRVAELLWDAPSAARNALAERHWPGPLTIVAAAHPGLPAPLLGPDGVGVRVSSHPWAQALAAALGGPITATSANLTGRPPADTVSAAREQLGDAVDLYLDAGRLPGGAPSTVVAVAPDGTWRVLRAGAVSLAGTPSDPTAPSR